MEKDFVVLITGASRGLGVRLSRETREFFLQCGRGISAATSDRPPISGHAS
jgi:NAD(P)-dependent dehydrogenase (short-subunit alcohol dehydrogenase family)